MLEESFHFDQNMRGDHDDLDIYEAKLLKEIDTQRYLLNNAERYKISRAETEITKLNLETYLNDLEEYRRTCGEGRS